MPVEISEWIWSHAPVIDIRLAAPHEAPSLAVLHAKAFPGFFLSSLGTGFLTLLYRGFISYPEAVCLVACENRTVIGVVAGPIRPREFFRNLLCLRGMGFLWAAIPGLLRSPSRVMRRLLAALFYRGEAPRHENAALVSTICVAPGARGSGVAVRLLAEFCNVASARGARFVYLTTDHGGNDQVNSFYERAGFVLESEIKRDDGRTMNRYVKDLQTYVAH